MKAWKTSLVIGGILIVLVVGTLAAAPLLFRDTIEARVNAAIHDKVDARVEFGSVGLSFFRNFPNLAFSLRDLSVTGVDAFAGDTLAHVGDFRLVVDLGSAIRSLRGDDPLVVRSIIIDRPYLHARVLEDGRASWDILKAADEAAEVIAPADGEPAPVGGGLRVALRGLEVRDGRVALDDARAGVNARIEGLRHRLSGDFRRERFTLRTETHADGVTFRQLGVPYLTDARLDVRADLDADMTARRFTFRDNRLALNELAVGFDGVAALPEDGGVDLDLTFAGDRAGFREILSLVPALYRQDFESLEAAGTVAVHGHVRGRYGPAAVPAFGLTVDVDDGTFRYADLPMIPARGIFLDLVVRNPGGDLDSTVVDVSRFDIAFGDEPFHATAALATPISDPDIRLAMNGRLDLGAMGRALKLEGVDTLRGLITTDATVHTRLSYVESEQYDRVEARGNVAVTGLSLRSDELPHPVDIDAMHLELSPAHAELLAFRARVGASDFQGTGRLDNLLDFALRGGELRGRATLASRFLDLDEWMTENDEGLQVIPVPANLDLALAATVDRLRFGALDLRDARGAVRVKDRRATLDEFAVHTLGGRIVTSGWYETADVARPTFDLELAMSELDIRGAFETFNTVRALAPAAQYATGRFSADLAMRGALSGDMMPVLELLNGEGSVQTAGVSLEGVPALHRIAEALHVERLRDPRLADFTSAVEVRDGRLHVQPFDVQVGGSRINVAGSNGIDQSLDYRLQLELPSAELGDEAAQTVTGLLAESGRVGVDLATAEAVRLDAVVGGTMSSPSVRVEFGDAVASAAGAARQQLETRLREETDRRLDDVAQRADAARDSARARAAAEADRIIAEAEERAEQIRAEAARLAEQTREEGHAQADRIEAEAKTPLARVAAREAAERLRKETDARADRIVEEADRRAEQLLEEARRRAEGVGGEG